MEQGEYFRNDSAGNCLDGEALRGGDFLLWGEPGLRRGLGVGLFRAAVKVCGRALAEVPINSR
jgi:hypothetical protein